jgi:hypothetical protein
MFFCELTTFFLVLFMNIKLCDSYICVEGRCDCMRNGIMVCDDVVDQSILTFSERILSEYSLMVVGDEMKCTDVFKLEKRSGLSVVNIDCNIDINQRMMLNEDLKSGETNDGMMLNGKEIGTYIFNCFEFILVLITLVISTKNRHNIAPLIKNLPRLYRSNRTFIKNLFKVNIYFLFLRCVIS